MNQDLPLPTVSVIIVTMNGEDWLRKCVPSVKDSTYPKDKTEIIVVDNGSKDGSLQYLKETHNDVRVIALPTNIGWSPANNEGMKICKGEIVVCLSNDMEVESNWLDEIVNFMQAHIDVGVVQCNSLSMWDRKTYDSSMNYLDIFGYSYGYLPSANPKEVFFAEGMAFAIRREVIESVGMLDDYYFMEYDDMDYSWRVRLGGYRVFFLPSSRVYHARGGTVGRTYFQRVKNVEWYTRNHFVTLIKNQELKTLVVTMPVVTIIELAKTGYLFAVKREKELTQAALKGMAQIIKDSGLIWRKRKAVQKIRKLSDKQIRETMHYFDIKMQIGFIENQSKGKRFIQEIEVPIRGVK